MYTEELIKYIENPKKLNEYSLSELRALTKKYPYFHTAYALLLVNLKNIGDPRFEELLRKYAIYIKDRNELFRNLNFIEGLSEITEPLEEHKERTEQKEKVDQTFNEQNIGVSPDGSDKIARKHDKKSNALKEDEPRKRTEEKKKKQYTREYLGNRISDTLSKQINEADQKNTKNKEAEPDFFILDKTARIKDTPDNGEKPAEKDQASHASGNMLADNQDEVFELDEKSEEPKERNDYKESGKRKVHYSTQYFDEDYLREINDIKQEGEDLIDQFIKENPELEVKEPEKMKEKDISMDSVEEKDDFLTEKLANLYEKQGYYKKAIEAFEKLSLKYPKKSDYFAKQIERINQIINEQ